MVSSVSVCMMSFTARLLLRRNAGEADKNVCLTRVGNRY